MTFRIFFVLFSVFTVFSSFSIKADESPKYYNEKETQILTESIMEKYSDIKPVEIFCSKTMLQRYLVVSCSTDSYLFEDRDENGHYKVKEYQDECEAVFKKVALDVFLKVDSACETIELED